MKPIHAICCLLLITGCQTYSLQELRQKDPTGTPFQQALAREYTLLATQEEQNYDWTDSWYFADKGLFAAYGNDVGPEEPANWNVSPEAQAELEQARDDLLTALRPEVVNAKPELAARAYRYFDCWVERADDGWENDKITECKRAFHDALSELQATDGGIFAEQGVDTISYIVFFDWNRATLNPQGQKIVMAVADSLVGQTGYEVILHGHTDTTGLERFNLTLSNKRAKSVKQWLIKGGVASDVIKIFAFGESDPKVPTADGVNEPKNRRVEIFIQ